MRRTTIYNEETYYVVLGNLQYNMMKPTMYNEETYYIQ